MNARIDAWLIPNGICAWDMEVAHYMNGSHSYTEDLHSVIRKFASRLNQCYFMKLDNRTKKIIKELSNDSEYYQKQKGVVVFINLLNMMPARIDQMQDGTFNVILTEEVVKGKLLAAFRKYLYVGDTRNWNIFCRWLLISYGQWANKTGFQEKLRLFSGDEFFRRPCDFGDDEFWEHVIL